MNDGGILPRKTRFDFTVDTLPPHPLYDAMEERFRRVLAECGLRADYETGDKVVAAGEPASGFHLVVKGSIDLEAPGEIPAARVQTIKSGEVLGWSWLFPPYYWHFNAKAREPVQTVFFYGSRLRQQCERDHEFGYALISGMSRIFLGNLRADRDRRIEAVFAGPKGLAAGSDYLAI